MQLLNCDYRHIVEKPFSSDNSRHNSCWWLYLHLANCVRLNAISCWWFVRLTVVDHQAVSHWSDLFGMMYLSCWETSWLPAWLGCLNLLRPANHLYVALEFGQGISVSELNMVCLHDLVSFVSRRRHPALNVFQITSVLTFSTRSVSIFWQLYSTAPAPHCLC